MEIKQCMKEVKVSDFHEDLYLSVTSSFLQSYQQ